MRRLAQRAANFIRLGRPLFLAGGEGDRVFARFYPTIAIDGCELRCAARATEMFSSKPAASLVVTDLIAEHHLARPEGKRRLNAAGLQAVEITANHIAQRVDELLERKWSRRAGEFVEETRQPDETSEPVEATCACGSGIPIQKIHVEGQIVPLVGLPLIFQQFREAGKTPDERTAREVLETVRIYNHLPPEEDQRYLVALQREYAAFCEKQEVTA